MSDYQITAEIAIDIDGDVPLGMYAGQLEGPIVYDGQTLSPGQLSFTAH